MIKTVIFDFNGTLFMDSDYHKKAWIAYAKQRLGKDISVEQFKNEFMGKPNVKILQMLDPSLSNEQALIYSEEKEVMYRTMVINDGMPRLVEGAEVLFNFLKIKNISFTIASAANVNNFIFYRKVFNLDDYFNPNLLVMDDGSYDSKVMMYQRAIELLNGDLSTTYVFEDARVGIDCALLAGIKQLGIIDENVIDHRFKHYRNFNEVLQDKSFVLECIHD